VTSTEIEFAGCGASGVRHIATHSVENLLLDLRDAVTVEDAHGVVLRVTSAAVVGVNYVQHLSQHGSLDVSQHKMSVQSINYTRTTVKGSFI